jgi:transcriptional regulator with AAA-type ATPase domain
VEAWLSLWTPELSKPDTAVIVENVDLLPAWAAQELSARAAAAVQSLPAPGGSPPTITWAMTAEELAAIPQPLAAMVETVVPVPALRERAADVMPLARYAARQTRMREVDFTAAAEHALTGYGWPGNVDELFTLVHDAALRTETIDVRHLPSLLVGRAGPHLTRIEAIERDEIIRCLSRPGITVAAAATELGISRATIYRRMARLGITAAK